MKMLRIISTKPAFRRAGLVWSGTTELQAAELTEKQIEQLKAEPLLVVQEFDQAEEKTAGSKATGKAPAEQK